MIKLSILSENVAGKNCLAEHGLSFLIEADKTVLFDTGASDLFIQNAKKMDIDLNAIDAIVLSHGHDDHTGGLQFLKNKKLICHPDVFLDRYRKTDSTPLGLQMTVKDAKQNFDLTISRKTVQISEKIWFLGEIPRLNDFEAKETAFKFDDGTDDFVMDDTGIAIIGNDGLIVVSGCAHSGICNMVEYAMKVTGAEKVHAVIGGFHLKKNDELTQRTISHFKSLNVNYVIPSHCTMLPALAAFYNEWNFVQLKTGNVLRF